MKKNLLRIVAQAFYGNRTETEIDIENLDRFILGYIDNKTKVTEEIDRTIVKIPNTDIVIIYNKYAEERRLKKLEKWKVKEEIKPLAIISEKNLEIYSRCIACRMNENGELKDLEEKDYEVITKYLAE